MNHRILRRVAMVLAVSALFVAGCTTGGTSSSGSSGEGSGGLVASQDIAKSREQLYAAMKGKKINFVAIIKDNPTTKAWLASFTPFFESLGATFNVDDGGNDVDNMSRIIDARINDGVDVLIIQNPDVGAFSEQVRRAHEKGIRVVSLLTPGTQSADAYVGPDTQAMAEQIGERMVTDCEAKGKNKVALISGYGTDAMSIAGSQGWKPVFEKAGLEVVSEQNSQFSPTVSNQVATTVLQQHKDLCGFAVIWDQAAQGAAEAVEAAGLQGEVGVYATDAVKSTCEAIADGRITATAAYNTYGMGAAAAYAVQELLLVDAPAGSVRQMGYVPFVVADKTNIDQAPGACY